MATQRGFTWRYKPRVNVLKTPIGVSLPIRQEEYSSTPKPVVHACQGIWDTGATGSLITNNIVQALGLQPINVVEIHTPKGKTWANVYLVNVILPDSILVQGVKVTEGSLPNGDDILIGMDIIGLGDFAVTNVNNQTTLSFRIPSHSEIDFVPEMKEHNIRQNGNRQARRKLEKGTGTQNPLRKGFRN